MSRDDLITWKPEPVVPEDSWGDLLNENKLTDEEAYRYNIEAAKRQREQIEAENSLGHLNAAEIAELWAKETAEREKATLPARQIDAVHRFVQATPELVLNEKTMTRIDAYLKAAKLDATEPAHFEAAYRALTARNLLDIDESRRPRQPWKKEYSEAELYAMSEEQLKELCQNR